MKIIISSLLLAIFLLLTSCWVKILNSAFEDRDLIFDESLVGTWTIYTKDSIPQVEQKLVIDRKGDSVYNITMIYFLDHSSSTDSTGKTTYHYGKRDTLLLEGRLGKIGSSRYLEMKLGQKYQDVTAKLYFLTSNNFLYRIKYDDKSLSLSTIQFKYFKKLAQKSKLSFYQGQEDETILVTATTKQIKSFLKKYERDKELFGDENIYSKE